jgi:hypothetical protein
MKNEVTTNQKSILVKIADQLLKDQQELDSLAVQFSLGKAEAKDKFEEAKMQMKKSVQEFKKFLSSEQKQIKDSANSVKVKLNDLEDYLAIGKAETKEMFKEQKKNIQKGVKDVMDEIKKTPELVKLANYFTAASEKINLQMELFEKKIEAEKKELTKEFKGEMTNARNKIDSIIAKTKEKKDDFDLKLVNFSNEIHLVYDHIKKAIQAL